MVRMKPLVAHHRKWVDLHGGGRYFSSQSKCASPDSAKRRWTLTFIWSTSPSSSNQPDRRRSWPRGILVGQAVTTAYSAFYSCSRNPSTLRNRDHQASASARSPPAPLPDTEPCVCQGHDADDDEKADEEEGDGAQPTLER